MNATPTLDQHDQQRLTSSLVVLLPRVSAITAEFCTLLEIAASGLRLRLPSDERQIEPVVEHLLGSVADMDVALQLAGEFAEQGKACGIQETDLPTLLAAIQTAIAETAGYTWTDQLEQTWTRWFDGMSYAMLSYAHEKDQLAA